jgi:hypothetical protein
VIHHQFPGIELVSPVYACDSAICHLSPDQCVDVGSTTQASFNINFSWRKPIGILMYELKNTKQSNKDTISSEDEATCTQLYIAWKINNSKKLCIVSDIIEHDKGCVWNRDNLIKLAHRYKLYDIKHGPVEHTYLMHDNTALMTRVNVICEEECYKLELTISKTSIKYGIWRLEYIDMDR